MDDLDLGDVDDTGYERDIDVEVIDGFYHQNVAFMNEKVQLFADFWMRLYSECCLQRDYSVASIVIKGYMEHKNYNMKIEQSKYAFQSYDHLLVEIKDILRSGNFNESSLIHIMSGLDNYIIDNSPLIENVLKDYNERFTYE